MPVTKRRSSASQSRHAKHAAIASDTGVRPVSKIKSKHSSAPDAAVGQAHRVKAGDVSVRRDIRELEDAYYSGVDKKPLEDLVRAWKGVQALPPDDSRSFFKIAGYHGEPFRGAGWSNPSWWGGYCNHGNVLFPVWHRAYLLELERALQSIVENVTLPYWNEVDERTERSGLPRIFLEKKFKLDEEEIDNPLYSYKFQVGVCDHLTPIQDHDYSKPPGYETVRYPFAGLAGSNDIDSTKVHNDELVKGRSEAQLNDILNGNVQNWLYCSSINTSDGKSTPAGLYHKYQRCLDAPNYTVFSNTTSAQQWNDDHFCQCKGEPWQDSSNAAQQRLDEVVSLESPHNGMHLAIGGFEVPGSSKNSYPGASGDMGENDTASFDPIFYFHHCFIDKMFWEWQEKWKATERLEVIENYPGTNSVDSQGPTPGVAGNTWLNMDSPLQPFKETLLGGPDTSYVTGKQLVNIRKLGKLSYRYDTDGVATLKRKAKAAASSPAAVAPTLALRIPHVSRAEYAGSFVISTWVNDQLVHVEPVLSRWHVTGCKNCQTHLDVATFVPLHGRTGEDMKNKRVTVCVHPRSRKDGKSKDSHVKVFDEHLWSLRNDPSTVRLGYIGRTPNSLDTTKERRRT